MIPRGLLCAAMLLAIPALPLPSLAQAAVQPAGNPVQQDTDSAQPETSPAQPETSPAAPQPSLRVDCASAVNASTLIGKHGCVAGRVFRITVTHHGNTRIYLCPSRRECSFHATVYAGDSSSVGDLHYLRGKVVAIVGDVTEFRGAPQIVISDKAQIQVAAESAPQEFDAAEPHPRGRGRHNGRHSRAW